MLRPCIHIRAGNLAEPGIMVAREGGKNTWFHVRNLADDTSKLIVRPNNDTLYSSAALDMDSGPFVISMPPSDRYWSVEFMRDNTMSSPTSVQGNMALTKQ